MFIRQHQAHRQTAIFQVIRKKLFPGVWEAIDLIKFLYLRQHKGIHMERNIPSGHIGRQFPGQQLAVRACHIDITVKINPEGWDD